MIAIVLEEDQHSKTVIESMLTQIGYVVLHASGYMELSFFIQRYRHRISLILAARSATEGLDLPISRQVIRNRSLDLVPMVLMTDPWLLPHLSHWHWRHSRIDDCINRPFGLGDLKRSIARARRRRAALRSTLLVGGKTRAAEVSETVLAFREEVHWRSVIQFDSAASFEQAVSETGFKIGSVVIEPELLANDRGALLHSLGQFKRSALGCSTPVAAVGQNAAEIRPLRPCCDLFLPTPQTGDLAQWARWLRLLSVRLLRDWEAKERLTSVRYALRAGKIKTAAREISPALKLDGERWELLELAGVVSASQGRTAEAKALFEKALATNPCSPFSHLRMLELAENPEERLKLAERARAYCPAHPQVRERVTSL